MLKKILLSTCFLMVGLSAFAADDFKKTCLNIQSKPSLVEGVYVDKIYAATVVKDYIDTIHVDPI